MATFEVQHYRVELVADRVVKYQTEQVNCSLAAVSALSEHLSRAPSEHLVVAYLSNSLTLLDIETVSVGGGQGTAVTLPEVFRGAILARANTIIVAHNHPSECADPSDEDIAMTRVLKEAGELLSIHLLDHIVVTKKCAHSILSGDRFPLSLLNQSTNPENPS